ncbi:hypothetical protein ACTWQB_09995 [Piscibacillus sp. B03]|uniref:hypothetical protein n=1 Tax=Piscibacillus sp. B03 TaxID=3457430 RepID=UPI003FCE4E90
MKRLIPLLILTFTLIPFHNVLAENDSKINLDYLVKYGEVKHIVPATKLTLDALPFTVKMPEYLPFNGIHQEFITSGINYYEKEGKIDSDLRLDNKGNPNERIELVFGNFPHKNYDSTKNKNIENKVYYVKEKDRSIIYFVYNQDIYYRIDYVNKEIPHEERVMELEKIFNSLTSYKNILTYK